LNIIADIKHTRATHVREEIDPPMGSHFLEMGPPILNPLVACGSSILVCTFPSKLVKVPLPRNNIESLPLSLSLTHNLSLAE
jgi:hypothetical protein